MTELHLQVLVGNLALGNRLTLELIRNVVYRART